MGVAGTPPPGLRYAAEPTKCGLRRRQYEQALSLARSALASSPNDVRILTLEAIAWSEPAGAAPSRMRACDRRERAGLRNGRLQRPAKAVPFRGNSAHWRQPNSHIRYQLAAGQFMAKSYTGSLATHSIWPRRQGKLTGNTPRATAVRRFCIAVRDPQILRRRDYHDRRGSRACSAVGRIVSCPWCPGRPRGPYDRADADFATGERLDPRRGYGSFAQALSQVQQPVAAADFARAAKVRQAGQRWGDPHVAGPLQRSAPAAGGRGRAVPARGRRRAGRTTAISSSIL